MFEMIHPIHWLAQPRAVREVLAKDLNIPKTGLTEVRDQELISDGYTVYDLQHITVEKLIEYVGKKKSFQELWEASVEKAKVKCGIAVEEKKEVVKEEPKVVVEIAPKVLKNNSKDPNKIDLAEEF